MIGALYKPPCISPLIAKRDHREKQTPHKKIVQVMRKIENSLLEPLTVTRETFLFYITSKHSRLKNVYRRADKDGHEGRCHAIGIAVTSVDDIFKNTKLKGTATRICQQTPRNRKLPMEKDPVITLRGKKFIETFLVHKTPLDNKTYIAALGVGYKLKKCKFDPLLTDLFAHVWREREQQLNCSAVIQSKVSSQKRK